MGIDLLQIVGGDWRFFWPENINTLIHIPYVWDALLNTGIGMPTAGTLWLISYLQFSSLFTLIGLPWFVISIIFWVLPALLFSFFSSYFVCLRLLSLPKKYAIVAGIIYSTNTYFILVLTGGQLGISLAYSLTPLVIYRFFQVYKDISMKNSLLAGLSLSLQLLFDPRFVYISILVVILYWITHFTFKNIVTRSIYTIVIPGCLTVLIHSFWIIPLLLIKTSPLPVHYDSIQQFTFLSFADFTHTISLLHPNWPDNIFGKVSFMKPEFIGVAFIVYSSLFLLKFSKNKKNNAKEMIRIIAFLNIVGLVGAFLAKGSNEPFGILNVFLFLHVPGMQMFRDATKFYTIIAFSYSLLIPFTLYSCSKYFDEKALHIFPLKKIENTLIIIFIAFWGSILFFTSHFDFVSVFIPRSVPSEYIALKNYLVSASTFSRTLWIPQWQRYGYFSYLHPAIGRDELLPFFTKKDQLLSLRNANSQQLLQESAVRYVVVPQDSNSELFLHDNKYSEKEYQQTVDLVAYTKWLKLIKSFGKIKVFEVEKTKDHFWSPNNLNISYTFINPTKYKVQISHAHKNDRLIFSEGYSSQWVGISDANQIRSVKYHGFFNSFVLPKDGNYTIEIYFQPQTWVKYGLIIGLVTFCLVIVILIALNRKKRKL